MKQLLTSNTQHQSRILIATFALLWYLYIPISLYFGVSLLLSNRSQSIPVHFGWMFLVCFLLAAHVSLLKAVSLTHSMSLLFRADILFAISISIIWYGMNTSVPWKPIAAICIALAVLNIIAWNLRRLPDSSIKSSPSSKYHNPVEQAKTLVPVGQQEATATDPIRYQAVYSNTNFSNLRGMTDIKSRVKTAAMEIANLHSIKDPKNNPRNGILLFGDPGNGKTYLVECLAGEMKLPLISVSNGDIASKWNNESTQNVMKVFQDARSQAPCILFLDEIDSFIKNRDASGSSSDETLKLTNSILTEIVKLRKFGVLLIGATNYLDTLDKAAIREGRFDFRIEITSPDEEARRGILLDSIKANTAHIPFEAASIDRLAKRWEGFSVKRIQAVGEELATMDRESPIDLIDSTQMSLALRRLQGRKGKIPESTMSLHEMHFNDQLRRQLTTIASRMSDAERIEDLGGSVPKGILFFGEPGTGKTETARSLAKETSFAFLSTSGNDLIRNPNEIDRILMESRDIRPCIVFIDEADDILANRNYSNVTSITNKLLTAMDGASGQIKDIVYIAATNHPENIDPAALRGGRFTEKLFFQLPDQNALSGFIAGWIKKSRAQFDPRLAASDIAMALGDGVSLANAGAILQESVNYMIGRSSLDGNNLVGIEDIHISMHVIQTQN